MQKIWAFDLDGVFVPDIVLSDAIRQFPMEEQTQIVTRLINFLCHNYRPLFEPIVPYVIITGRPIYDKEITQKWINRFFVHKPLMLYHDAATQPEGLDYKVQVLNDHPEIVCYVESDPDQVEYIRNGLTREVELIHFKSFIDSSFLHMLKRID